ncbi:MAG: bacterial Ig-like domain-containing protein [Tidjanibacter sp.]|nr:bacterial Ig-like domain-containing protein [Tidjanibacter sp.]
MKKMMKFFGFIAVAVMSLTACQNEIDEQVNANNEGVTLEIVADMATRSTFGEKVDGAYPSTWTGDETVRFIANDKTIEGAQVETKPTEAGATTHFNVTFTGGTDIENGVIFALTPIGNFSAGIGGWGSHTIYSYTYLTVPTTQTPLANSVDEDAHILIAEHNYEGAFPTGTVGMSFKHALAYGKMKLTLPEGVEASQVILHFTQDVAGNNIRRYYEVKDTYAIGDYSHADKKDITLIPTNVVDGVYWFGILPTGVLEGDMEIEVVATNGDIYKKTIATADDLAFNKGQVSSFKVTMAACTPIEDVAIELPWSENFDSEDLSKYNIVNGSSDTKVYPDDTLAGGEAGEILIGKEGGSMSATFVSDGTAKTLNFWFKSNKGVVVLTSATEGVTITKLTNTGYTVALADGVETFKLTLENTSSDNARVDDIVLTEAAPTITSLTIEGQTITFTEGDEFVFGGTVKAVYENGVIEEITDYSVDSSTVNMATAGEYTVTVTYSGVSATYTINVASADVVTKTFDLSVTGTYANSSITWVENGVTIVQAQGKGTSAVNSSYTTSSTMRLYQGHTLTFSSSSNITKIEMVSKSTNYGKTATVNVGTLNNPKTSGCTITWTGSAKEIIITNGTGSGGSQLQTSKITITYEVSGEGGTDTPEAAEQTLSFSQTTASATVGQDFTEPTLSGAMTTVTYTSSNAAVATVDANTGAVTLVGAGETTITATAEETTEYKSATASYTLTVAAASTGGGDDSATTVTLDLTAQNYTKQQQLDGTTLTINGVSIAFAKGSAGTATQYYTTGTAVRIYNGAKMTVSAPSGKNITSIVITGQKNNTASTFTADTGTFDYAWDTASYKEGTWTGSSNSVVFTAGGTKHVRIQKVVVTFE